MKITNLTQLVFAFGLEMLSKLKYKKAVIEITNIPAEEKTVKENRKVIIDNLHKNVEDGDWIDVGNLAAILWNIDENIGGVKEVEPEYKERWWYKDSDGQIYQYKNGKFYSGKNGEPIVSCPPLLNITLDDVAVEQDGIETWVWEEKEKLYIRSYGFSKDTISYVDRTVSIEYRNCPKLEYILEIFNVPVICAEQWAKLNQEEDSEVVK